MLVVKLPPNIFSIILDLSQIKQALPLSKLHMAFAATRYWILIGNYSLDVFYKLRVGSRTIGYLKTSVRCCMAERYFEKFWQHGKPVPRSCHADQSS